MGSIEKPRQKIVQFPVYTPGPAAADVPRTVRLCAGALVDRQPEIRVAEDALAIRGLDDYARGCPVTR